MKKIFIIIGLIIISIGIITYLIIDDNRLKKIDKTKHNNYNEYVEVINDTDLYKKENKKYIKIGNIKKETKLELDKTDYKEDYFKLKDTNYYISYKDIKKIKKINKDNYYENYILFNKNIITNKSFSLSNNITIDEQNEFKLIYQSDEYYVLFNNNLYSTKDVKELVDSNNTELVETTSISVFNVNDTANLKEKLDYLKENNYTTITLNEYKLWLDNKVRLKENVVLFVTNEIKDEMSIFNEYNYIINVLDDSIKFNNVNKVSTKESKENSYEIKNTDLDKFKKMVSKEKIVEVVVQEPIRSNSIYAGAIPVLNYHFFYDSSIGEVCNETICLETSKFEEHLKYLKENNFKTLTMEEFRAWMYGEIEVPNKSVLLTIDDGAMGTSTINGNKLIPLLEKYDLHATLFLVTAWWSPDNYRSNNLDIESHGNDIHKVGSCGTHNLKCLSHDELYNDLKTSMDIVGSYTSFCYPFYVHSNDAVSVLRELNVPLAFGGGNFNATRNSNKYYIPRYPIYSNITMDQFIRMVS